MDATARVKVRRSIVAVVIVALLLGNGFLWGFYTGTGESPMMLFQSPVSYTPPDLEAPSLDKLADVLAEDDTSEQEYREGFNCVDYAWTLMRALHWQGISSSIIGITFEDGTSHAVLLVPTEDKSWQFIDPQGDTTVSPKVGSYYNGKKIESIQVMVLNWVDIMEFTDNPDYGDVE